MCKSLRFIIVQYCPKWKISELHSGLMIPFNAFYQGEWYKMCKMSPASTLIVNRTYGNYQYNFDENKLNY